MKGKQGRKAWKERNKERKR